MTLERSTPEPTQTVYIVCRDHESGVDALMVFHTEAEAERYADWYGGDAMVLPSEPVFSSAEQCAGWCEPSELPGFIAGRRRGE